MGENTRREVAEGSASSVPASPRRARAEPDPAAARCFDLCELAPFGYCTVSEEGLILEANLAAAALFGVSRDALVKQPLSRFVLPADRDVYHLHGRQRLEPGVSSTRELRMVCQDGKVFWARLMITAAPGADGSPVCRVVMIDITTRMQAEEELRESEERLRFELLLTELSSDFINLPADKVDCQIEDAQRRICEVLGLDLSTLWQRSAERPADFTLTHVYCPPDFPRPSEPMKASETLPWCLQEVLAGRVIAVSSTDEVPEEAARDKEVRRQFGVKSTLTIPLLTGEGPIIGALSFSTIRSERTWPDTLVKRLQLVAQVFTNALVRNRTEQAFRESAERLRDVTFSMADWVWEVDAKGVYTYASPKGFELLGDVIGKTPFDFMPPDEAARVSRVFSEIAAKKAPIKDLENWNIRKDGERICLLTNGVPILDKEGNLKGYRGVDKDIAERKRADQALRESEARLSLATEAAGAGLWAMELDGSGVWASAKTREFFQFGPDQPLTYQDFIERIHPEDRETLNRAMQRAMQSGETLRVDFRISLPEGQTRWLAAKGGLDGEPGKPQTHVVGVSIDITRRKQAEEALAESELHYRMLFEAAPVGIIMIGTDGLVESANPEQARLYGYDSPQQLIGRPAILFVAERDRERASGNLHNQLQGEDAAPRWYTSVRRDGSEFISEVTGGVIRGPRQEVQGYLCITRDITEQREAEAKLRAAYAEIKALKDRVEAENRYLRSEIRTVTGYEEIIGQSEAIRHVLGQAEQVAPTDSTVLIRGPTGTGKELLAHVIHARSPRCGKLFVTVNLASLPSSLLEGELFGREKGAYTGALTRQTGRFEVADGGTVFLDEIGEMPLETQAKLLRVLQQGEFERLGSTRTLRVNVRIIAATNRDLDKAVRSGQFREDLYYRLNVFPIRIPPLCERREDIPPLVWSFVREFGERMGKRIERISHRTMEVLMAYPWPGNVRELRNVIERSTILTTGHDLWLAMPETPGGGTPASLTLADADKKHILGVLEMTNWRVRGKGGAAERLGLEPSTLESKMKKLGIRRTR